MREARVVGLLGPALLCYCAAASTFSSSGSQRIRDRSEIADSGTEVRGQRCVYYGLHDNQPTETVELQTYPSGVSTPGYNKPVALTRVHQATEEDAPNTGQARGRGQTRKSPSAQWTVSR